MKKEIVIGIVGEPTRGLPISKERKLPSERVLLPTSVAASFMGITSGDLAKLMGSGRGRKEDRIRPTRKASATEHELSFADACRAGVLYATKPYVTTPKLRRVLWDSIPSSKIEEAAYAPAGKSVFLLIPADSLRGKAFRVEFRAPEDPKQSGDLLLNLSVLVREVWEKTEKYLKVAMTAKARREEGPQVELRHLDRIRKQIMDGREELERRERGGASPESLRNEWRILRELEAAFANADREVKKRARKGVKR